MDGNLAIDVPADNFSTTLARRYNCQTSYAPHCTCTNVFQTHPHARLTGPQ